ncbi:P-loop containing nucleoside triphosphate hydrolase protein [Coprinopsis sp. MPI-PUGE-AT-0042]|nr:P-loop containing nucleoside triphosphate hydrolase protein [Coprinopsis sp. MPI-PUGE-AT-0042]
MPTRTTKERPKTRISVAPDALSARRNESHDSEKKHGFSSSNEHLDANYIMSPPSLFSRISSGCSSIGWLRDADVTSDFADLVLTANDKVIVVMGQTGSGKSTFINCAVGHEVARVTHTVTSCTEDIQLLQCVHPKHPNQRVFLVDTPGFDHTKARSPRRILQRVSEWLIATYKQDVKLSGILQLDDITQVRMTGSHRVSLRAFSELCGAEFLSNVVLVSTGWEDLDNIQTGTKREQELQKMLADDHGLDGIRYSRFHERTTDAAWGVIDLLQAPRRATKIQSEVVDQHKPLEETSAFQTLRKVWKRWRLTLAG